MLFQKKNGLQFEGGLSYETKSGGSLDDEASGSSVKDRLVRFTPQRITIKSHIWAIAIALVL
jgi:hypothetical protein